MSVADPHGGQPIRRHGPQLSAARLAVILVHGRGGSAQDMLSLATAFGANDVAYIAPEAAGRTWYPQSFLAPIEENEPGISSGLRVLATLVDGLEREQSPPARVVVLGFSQGACLTLEFAARNPRRYAAIVGLSGAVIGPPGTPRNHAGSLDGTQVFLGCSDIDPHIPLARVHESAEVFSRLGASVDERIYPGMGHTVSQDEIEAIRTLLKNA
jgi:predicted esterase